MIFCVISCIIDIFVEDLVVTEIIFWRFYLKHFFINDSKNLFT